MEKIHDWYLKIRKSLGFGFFRSSWFFGAISCIFFTFYPVQIETSKDFGWNSENFENVSE